MECIDRCQEALDEMERLIREHQARLIASRSQLINTPWIDNV